MNPLTPIIKDFRYFDWKKYAYSGYATHTLVGALFAYIPLYIPIKVAIVFFGCLPL
jgi:hypothetical protein